MRVLVGQFKKVFAVVAVILSVSGVGAVSNVETDDYRRVYQEVQDKVAKYGSESTLVVFDIDNTLLVNNQDLGTDQWFEWQKNLIAAKQFEYAVAKSFNELIETQALLYALGQMSETEPMVSDVVERIQARGLKTLVLTARDAGNRDATLRELARNGMKFGANSLGQSGFAGKYLPYNLAAPEAYGITKEETARWALKPAREVAFTEGVLLAAGQHKGAMLRTLLHKTGHEFKAIVFVDDKLKNISDMGAAFDQLETDVTLIRYSREDENVARFEHSNKSEVKEQWSLLSYVLSNVFSRGSTSLFPNFAVNQ